MAKLTIPEIELMTQGHTNCGGCGLSFVVRYLLKALGPNTTVNIPACCMAVMPGVFPYTCLKVPLLYNAFETTAATAAGIRAAMDVLGKKDVNVVGIAGDGGTLDIGIQALSGAVERGDNIIYICYDNEAYMNTGIQKSGSTPYGAWTTTTPVGKLNMWNTHQKKNIVEIMVAHRIPYAATACVSFPEDFIRKLQKARAIIGPKFIHVLAPCPTGWRYSSAKTIEIGRLAVNSNVFPLYEVEYGKYTISRKPSKTIPVSEYIKPQGRFKHLGDDEIAKIQQTVDREWNLLLRREEFTKDMNP